MYILCDHGNYNVKKKAFDVTIKHLQLRPDKQAKQVSSKLYLVKSKDVH